MIKIARELDPWKPCDEQSHIQLVPKENKPDEARPITTFGIKRKALQYLVRGALMPAAKSQFLDSQYMHNDGVDKAIETTLHICRKDLKLWYS